MLEKVNDIVNQSRQLNQDLTFTFQKFLDQNVKYQRYPESDALNRFYVHKGVGCLLHGESVCEGYAKAWQLVALTGQYTSLYVSGKTDNSLVNEGHSWNIVRKEGKYYICDFTWNKHGYRYLCCDSKMIEKSHTPDAKYEYPLCNSLDCYHYSVMN